MRAFVGAAALYASTSLTSVALATQLSPIQPFSFDQLSARAKARAAEPFDAVMPALPEFVQGLDYDQYRKIQYRRGRGKNLGAGLGYQVQAFHLGWLFKEPVHLFEVDGGLATPLDFTPDDFVYGDKTVEAASSGTVFPGVAGFRINYPLNQQRVLDELISYLGASYFRAIGQNNLYGASARGLAINTWLGGPEEFPRFSDFYVERTAPNAPLVIYAALEGPSVSGAYRFEISPADATRQETVVDVTTRLYFRSDVTELGIAPLTSMFLFAEANRTDFDDYRPQVHDSNGLFMRRDGGEAVWRALHNPTVVANSYFAETNIRAFGLMQRGRDFETYQDPGARYEKRPSILIEPEGDWGTGSLRLIEIPAKLEAEDNIVAFWIPEKPFKAGDETELKYRMRWGDLPPEATSDVAHVVETRGGQGGVSGVENASTLRKFVVDFKGGPLDGLDPEAEPEIIASIAGGTITFSTVSRMAANGIWRLVIDAEVTPTETVELRANLAMDGKQLSETWLYQWRSA